MAIYDTEKQTTAKSALASYLETEVFRFSKYLLDDDDVPEDLKEWFWAFVNKEAALTNLNDVAVKRMMRCFENTSYLYMMTKPKHDHSFDEEVMLEQLRAKIHMKLLRSTGGKDRERFILGAQIQQNILEENEKVQPKGGIVSGFKKIMGMN